LDRLSELHADLKALLEATTRTICASAQNDDTVLASLATQLSVLLVFHVTHKELLASLARYRIAMPTFQILFRKELRFYEIIK
jgi:hypothetical protein